MSAVHILDEIVLQPEHIDSVLALLDTQYLPGISSRQTLSLSQRWVSPPVRLAAKPNTLWLLWTVTDIYGYYTMRGTAGPDVAAFWAAVDKLCLHRHRHVLGDAGQPLPGPLEDP